MAEPTDKPQASPTTPNDQSHSNADQPDASASETPSLDNASWAKVLAAMQAAEDAVSQAVHGSPKKST